MEQNFTPQDNTLFLLCLVVLTVISGLIVWFNIVGPLIRDIKYIKMEMSRSADENEFKYWEKELKTLYRRHLPIIGRFIK